jgi:hypothetical protein
MTDETLAVRGDHAKELLRSLGVLGQEADVAARADAAARAAGSHAVDEIVWPTYWRQAVNAVKLCQRAAEVAARQ